jgi:hypothetical protein
VGGSIVRLTSLDNAKSSPVSVRRNIVVIGLALLAAAAVTAADAAGLPGPVPAPTIYSAPTPAQSSNPFSLAATLVWNLTTSMTSADARQNFSRTMLYRSAGLESSGNARKVAYRNPF